MKKQIFWVTGLLIFTVLSCGKFENGPDFSLRSKNNRIQGDYRIDYVSVNDSVITRFWADSMGFCFKFDKPDFKPYIYGTLTIYTNLLVDSGTLKQFCWMHSYRIGDRSLSFRCIVDTSYYPGPTFYPLIVPDEGPMLDFEITRLTNEDLWLKHARGNDVYEIHFKE